MTDQIELSASRRRLSVESLGIAASGIGFGFVYGLAARGAGFSPIEAMAMSTIVFAGAAQFAAVGYVASGLAWPGVILLTALLNARHLLYSAALAPWMRDRPIWKRAVMAHLLTDEAFALSIAHFQRIGRADERGYWIAAIVSTFIPWNLATLAGVSLGGQIADPAILGLDVVFPGGDGRAVCRSGHRPPRARCRRRRCHSGGIHQPGRGDRRRDHRGRRARPVGRPAGARRTSP